MQKNHIPGGGELDKIRYRGTLDAFRKISKYEGIRGLYKGFGVSTIGILSGQLYITTYELGRMRFKELNERFKILSPDQMNPVRNALAGGCASLCSQTIVVPVDVVSQKQMVHTGLRKGEQQMRGLAAIGRQILAEDGVRGFYKGFGASLSVYAPSSAIWWGSYGYFREALHALEGMAGRKRTNASGRLVEATAGASAGIVATVVTNPMDVARTRLQVDGLAKNRTNLRSTLRYLWVHEGPLSLMKGVQPRIMATVPSSVLIITVYELVKRLSRKTPPKDESQ